MLHKRPLMLLWQQLRAPQPSAGGFERRLKWSTRLQQLRTPQPSAGGSEMRLEQFLQKLISQLVMRMCQRDQVLLRYAVPSKNAKLEQIRPRKILQVKLLRQGLRDAPSAGIVPVGVHAADVRISEEDESDVYAATAHVHAECPTFRGR